jgi:UDP-GlcNAc:undecaprenyl-phosphate GlcNAc-1-phosphate transferase
MPLAYNPIDMNLIVRVLVSLIAALVMSFAATPVVKSFAHKVGAIDVPKDDRRVHDHPIPRLGGLAVFLGFLLSVVLFADITKQIQGVLIGSVVVVIAGVIDDIVPLKAWIKLCMQIIAALIAVLHGVVIEILSNPNLLSNNSYLNLGFLAVPLTVIWIVAITNSVNLIDGLDGLAVGVSGIGSATMLVIALLVAEGNVAIIMAALAGACIGFMPYNINPAKIFAGDTGALLLGYVLATMSVIGLFKVYAIISFAVPFLVLALPLFDTIFAFSRRILKGQNPMAPDRGHVHHRLIDMGLTQKQAVAILYCISTVLGLSAVVLTTSGEMKAILLILAFVVAAVVGVFIMKTTHKENRKPAPEAAEEAPKEIQSEGLDDE